MYNSLTLLLLLLSLSVTFVHSCGVPRVLDKVVLVSAKWHCTGIHAEYAGIVYFWNNSTSKLSHNGSISHERRIDPSFYAMILFFRLQMGPRA